MGETPIGRLAGEEEVDDFPFVSHGDIEEFAAAHSGVRHIETCHRRLGCHEKTERWLLKRVHKGHRFGRRFDSEERSDRERKIGVPEIDPNTEPTALEDIADEA